MKRVTGQAIASLEGDELDEKGQALHLSADAFDQVASRGFAVRPSPADRRQ